MQTLGPASGSLAFCTLALALVGSIAIGCAAATASPPPAASPSATVGPAPSPSPAASADPNASTGTDEPSGDPGLPAARIVTPKPGQLDVRPIPAERLAATVNGHNVVVEVTYTSGVEPCYVLDSILVERGDHSFAITLRQGHGPGDNVCIEIAETVRAFVDLGELGAGSYTITDTQNGAAPITVAVG
jgi:hypothetical protein